MYQKIMLSAITLFVIFPRLSYGQKDTVQLNEIVIKANRIDILLKKVSQNVNMIDRKQITSTPAQSVQEVLTYVPGVDVRQRGANGVQADVGIRGGNFEQTLILLNGMKMSDPQTGHHMMNIPVPLHAISSIEVLKGPGSRLFGQNAYAGAINIITVLPSTTGLSLQGTAGDYGLRGGNIYASLPVKKFKQTISGSYDASNGYRHNSDYKISNVFYDAGMELNAKNELRINAGYCNRDFGANGFYSDRFPDQWEATETTIGSLSHTYKSDRFNLTTRGYARINKDEFRLKRDIPEFYTNNHTSNTYAVEINSSYRTKFGVLGAGVEYRYEKLNSSNLGERERKFTGVYLEHQVDLLKKLNISYGVYANYYEKYDWKFFPGVEAGYQLTGISRVYANYGISYRIPSYTELYYTDPANQSNPNLLPEEAHSYEGGYIFRKNSLHMQISYFHRSDENLIDWIRPYSETVPNPNKWTPYNIRSVEVDGLEAGVLYNLNWGKTFMIKSLYAGYTYIYSDPVELVSEESKYILNALTHQLLGEIKFSCMNKLLLCIKARYLERVALSPYFLLDLHSSYDMGKNISFFIDLTNVTDTEYIESGSVYMPGRWVKGGIVLKFGSL